MEQLCVNDARMKHRHNEFWVPTLQLISIPNLCQLAPAFTRQYALHGQGKHHDTTVCKHPEATIKVWVPLQQSRNKYFHDSQSQ